MAVKKRKGISLVLKSKDGGFEHWHGDSIFVSLDKL